MLNNNEMINRMNIANENNTLFIKYVIAIVYINKILNSTINYKKRAPHSSFGL